MSENKSSITGIQAAHIKCLHHQDLAADLVSTLALIPIQKGYVPKRWKIGIDSMIPKKNLSELQPEKLRIILNVSVPRVLDQLYFYL